MHAIHALPRPRLSVKTETMPIITAAASIPVLATSVWTVILAIVVNRPESADLYACLGAALASICTLIEARGNGRTVAQTITVFIGSAGCGTLAPGMLYSALRWKGWLSPDAEQYIIWQMWAAAGFFFAINGWAMAHTLNKRLVRKAEKTLDKWLPADDPPTRPVN
jgi:hypothetical protein